MSAEDECNLDDPLSLDDLDNGSDDERFANDRAPIDYTGMPEAEAADRLLNSLVARELDLNQITISGIVKKLNLLCSNSEHRALNSSEDLKLIRDVGKVTSLDLVLMGSSAFPMYVVFERAMEGVVSARTDAAYCGKGPNIDMCLAWLAHAAQCSVPQLVPAGEIFQSAVQYVRQRLVHGVLPLVEESDRVALAVIQTIRVLEILAVCDLRRQSVEDKSILLFAIAKIICDKEVSPIVHTRAISVVTNIFSATMGSERKLISEFSRVFPLVSDEMTAHRLVLECFRIAEVPPWSCLALLSGLFISVSERAECEPELEDGDSEEHFIAAHIDVIVNTFDNVMEVYEKERSKQSAVIAMIDIALHPEIVKKKQNEYQEKFVKLFEPLRKKGRKLNGKMDDMVIDSQIGTLITRMAIK